MKQQAGRIVLALVLILFGVAALLDSLNVINLPFVIQGPNMIWMLLFGISGIAFMVAFFSHGANWWAVIPGLTLIGLAILVGGLIPAPFEALSGAVFIGCLALSFWLVYLTRRENWWAIIPGGVLTSVAALIIVESFSVPDLLPVAVMFLGMGVTFLLVYLLPSPVNRSVWPLYPAAILGVMGVLFLLGAGQMFNWLAAVALIGIGAWIILRSMRR